MKETDLYEQIARYMNVKYKDIEYHFDLAGVNNPSMYTRSLYGRLNKPAWPDLLIAEPASYYSTEGSVEEYHGLFIELKKEGVKTHKKDGTLRADKHIIAQARVLEQLQSKGYFATFASGYDQAIAVIEEYLS